MVYNNNDFINKFKLMIMLNYFLLNKIDPKEVYTWFMEFSIDSYKWFIY